MTFVVELEQGVWLSKVSGDPGRTLVLENAKRWPTGFTAEKALYRARRQNPHRNFNTARVVELDQPQRQLPQHKPIRVAPEIKTGTATITYESNFKRLEWSVGCTSSDNEETIRQHFDKWAGQDNFKFISVRFEIDQRINEERPIAR